MNFKKLTEGQKKGIAVVAGVGVAAGVIYYLQKALAPTTTDELTNGGLFGGTTPGGFTWPEFKEEKGIPQDNLFPNGGGGGGGDRGYTPAPNGGGPPVVKGDPFPKLPKQFSGESELPLWPGAGGGVGPYIVPGGRANFSPMYDHPIGPEKSISQTQPQGSYVGWISRLPTMAQGTNPFLGAVSWGVQRAQGFIQGLPDPMSMLPEITIPLSIIGQKGSVTLNRKQPQVVQPQSYQNISPWGPVARVPSFSPSGSPTAVTSRLPSMLELQGKTGITV